MSKHGQGLLAENSARRDPRVHPLTTTCNRDGLINPLIFYETYPRALWAPGRHTKALERAVAGLQWGCGGVVVGLQLGCSGVVMEMQ